MKTTKLQLFIIYLESETMNIHNFFNRLADMHVLKMKSNEVFNLF